MNFMEDTLSAADTPLADLDALAWQRAVAEQHAGNYLTAAAAYLACAPETSAAHAQTLFNAAWCHELARQPQAAEALYRQALTRPSAPSLRVETLFRLGWIAIEARGMAAGREHLSALLDLADQHALAGPTVEHAGYWHAVCLEHDGELVEAAARYAPIAEHGNADLWHEAAYRRLLCLSQVGDLRGAAAAAAALLDSTHPVRGPARLQALRGLARDEAAQIARAVAAA
jgi:hypothetical protein